MLVYQSARKAAANLSVQPLQASRSPSRMFNPVECFYLWVGSLASPRYRPDALERNVG